MHDYGWAVANRHGRAIFRACLGLALSSIAAFGFGQQPSAEAKVFQERARQALEANPNLPYSPSTMLVQFAPGVSENARHTVRTALGGPMIERFQLVPGLEVVGTTLEPMLASRLLRGHPGVLLAEPDYTVHASVIPNDPSFASLWGLHNTGQSGGVADADIDAAEAWDTFKGDPNFVVADIDTGVQLNHPDLAANIWVNPGEVAGNGIDDDGNGRIDDMNGWDFVNGDNNPSDDNGHGSHTSGTIGAVGNNGVGVVGVCWNVKIMALKFLNAQGSGSTSAAISCLNYAVAKGVKVSNNSWGGGGYSSTLYNAINAAKSVGHLFIAAAGNSGVNTDASPHYPSSYNLDNIISVASTTRTDTRSSFSNYGATSVDLGAPGSSIYSTVPTNAYNTYSGTSMATPHVAGVAALVYGYRPTWTYTQVRNALFNTVRPISGLAGITVTGGVVNAAAALAYGGAPVNQAPVVTISSPSNGSTFLEGTSIAFAGSATDEDGTLSGNLAWSSNQVGSIGSGAAFSATLSVGTHVITASVTDSQGLQGSASVTITVQSAASPPAAPSNQNVVRFGTGLRVSWSDNSSNEDAFEIVRESRIGSRWSVTGSFSVGANVTHYDETPARGQHRYKIRAVNSVGQSAYTGWAQIKF